MYVPSLVKQVPHLHLQNTVEKMEETAQCDNETEREPHDVTSISDFK